MPHQIRFTYSLSGDVRKSPPKCLAILNKDNWDDFSFKTMFSLSVYDENGKHVSCGSVKIGFIGQTDGRTSDELRLPLEQLPDNFFSLGQDVEYYKKIRNELSEEFAESLLSALRDVVFDQALLSKVSSEKSFATSLTRGIRMSVIEGQFKRVLNGGAPLTDFEFKYRQKGSEKTAAFDLSFTVEYESKPPTNIHVLIGRNGVGKTTLLNNMTRAILPQAGAAESPGSFFIENFLKESPMPEDFFTAVVSVSFSAFDPFRPIPDQPNRNNGIAYFYIGMKNIPEGLDKPVSLKSHTDLCNDFLTSLASCFSVSAKKDRWVAAIKRLESDDNFAEMELTLLAELGDSVAVQQTARNRFERMSSGHAIVLLTMTRLVETVDEKTLVLMDEPESHLHPPLLSAFTRALSDLLNNRNGVAIIATHSPVVVQEVPRSCVWTMERSRAEGATNRPEIETFGENVGVLTREIFGLEVTRSGFHHLLKQATEQGKGYDEVIQEYGGHLGFEAQALLRALVISNATDTDVDDGGAH